MRNSYMRMGLVLLALLVACGEGVPSAFATGTTGGRRPLGTVTGSVKDGQGNPLAGAVVSLLREGAEEVVKEVRSAADGSYKAAVAPGRYVIRAIADGFSPTTFPAVTLKASEELVYRFNLEPAGEGRTAPERRADRDDPKYRIRATFRRRSIFNINESATDPSAESAENATAATRAAAGEDDEAAAGELADIDVRRSWTSRPHGLVETFYAATPGDQRGGFGGINFAALTPLSPNVDLIFTGQAGGFERFETTARVRANERHRVSMTLGAARLPLGRKGAQLLGVDTLEQVSVRAVDEWVVRDGVVVVLGLDYSRFLGQGGADSISPRLGFQFDADARTRLRAAYAPGTDAGVRVEQLTFGEDAAVLFKELSGQAVAIVDNRPVSERSSRLEFGVERVIDENSTVEATAFFDTVDGRGVGLLGMPLDATASGGDAAAGLNDVANQQGGARGLRVVYTRRVSQHIKASAAYAVGRGQVLSAEGVTSPENLFQEATFQTAAAQLDADVLDGTRVRTVLRFSPRAAVFAIDPFAGRLAVYDPSLSILVTQDLPNFGLPVRAEATLDARNLLDMLSSVEDGESTLSVNALRRMVRGGISVRF